MTLEINYTPLPVEVSTTNLPVEINVGYGDLGSFQAASDAAAASAESAALSSASAGINSGRLEVATFSELSTVFGYTTSGGRRQVAAGDLVRVVDINSTYQVKSSSSTDFHLDYTSGGGVKLVVNPDLGGYNVKAFGAKGDSSSNDTTPIQMAINATAGQWHPAVYLPAGLYAIDVATSLLVREGLTIYGDGRLSSQLVPLNLVGGTFIKRQRNIGSANAYINSVTIRDIGIILRHPTTADPANYRQIGIDFHSVTRSSVYDCYIGNYPFGESVGIIPRPVSQADARQGLGIVTSSTSASDPAYAGGEVNTFRDNLIIGVQRGGDGDDPQFFNPGYSSAAYAVVWERVEVQICEVGIAQWSQYGAGWTIKDCVFQSVDRARGSSNTTYGIYLGGYEHTVIGGYNESPNVDHEIFLASNSRRNRIYPRLSGDKPITDNGVGNVIETINGTTNQWSMRINKRGYDEHAFASAWVNFYWDTATSAIVIVDSYNVSSVTRVGAGDYNVAFAAGCMKTNSYTVSGSGSANTSGNPLLVHIRTRGGMSTAGCRILTRNLTTNTNADAEYISVVFFGGQ